MAALLGRLVAVQQPSQVGSDGGVPADHLSRLTRACGARNIPLGPPARRTTAMAVAGLVEPPTERELEVLGLIADGKRNREIADELVVSLETVKKHTTYIFEKLGVANRIWAAAHARQVGLFGWQDRASSPSRGSATAWCWPGPSPLPPSGCCNAWTSSPSPRARRAA